MNVGVFFPSSSVQKQMLDLLETWLRHKSDMVNFEAARAICEMKNVTPQQLTKAIAGELNEIATNVLLCSRTTSAATIPFFTQTRP